MHLLHPLIFSLRGRVISLFDEDRRKAERDVGQMMLVELGHKKDKDLIGEAQTSKKCLRRSLDQLLALQ